MDEINKLLRRGLLLEYITLGWNVVGVAVVLYKEGRHAWKEGNVH